MIISFFMSRPLCFQILFVLLLWSFRFSKCEMLKSVSRGENGLVTSFEFADGEVSLKGILLLSDSRPGDSASQHAIENFGSRIISHQKGVNLKQTVLHSDNVPEQAAQTIEMPN